MLLTHARFRPPSEEVEHEFESIDLRIPELDGIAVVATLLVRATVDPDTPAEGRYSPGLDGSVDIEFTDVTNVRMFALSDGDASLELSGKVTSLLWTEYAAEIEAAALEKCGDVETVLRDKARGR